jgi:hypothetical protein
VTGVIVQDAAWGYLPLLHTHSGVQAALTSLHRADIVDWDMLAEIAHLAGDVAQDLVIVGGAEVNAILASVQEALVIAAVAREHRR